MSYSDIGLGSWPNTGLQFNSMDLLLPAVITTETIASALGTNNSPYMNKNNANGSSTLSSAFISQPGTMACEGATVDSQSMSQVNSSQASRNVNKKRGRSVDRVDLNSTHIDNRANFDHPGSQSNSSQQKKKKIKRSTKSTSCLICSRSCTTDSSVTCGVCNLTTHVKCLGMNIKSIEGISVSDLADFLGYSCQTCRDALSDSITLWSSKQLVLETKVEKLEKIIDNLMSAGTVIHSPPIMDTILPVPRTGGTDDGPAINNSSSQFGNSQDLSSDRWTAVGGRPKPNVPHASVESSAASISTLIVKTVNNLQRRKSNVVVSGMIETSSEKADTECFIDVCDNSLNILPSVIRCRRLDRKAQNDIGTQANSRPRLLLVTLASEIQVTNIVKAAKNLRSAVDIYTRQNVFINRDLTKEESKMLYDRRVARRAANETSNATVPNSNDTVPKSGGRGSNTVNSIVSYSRTFKSSTLSNQRMGTRNVNQAENKNRSPQTEWRTLASSSKNSTILSHVDINNEQEFPPLITEPVITSCDVDERASGRQRDTESQYQ